MAWIFAAKVCHSSGLKLSVSLSGVDALDERSPLVPGEHQDRSLWVLGVTDGSAVGQVGYLHAVAAGSVAVGALAPRGTVRVHAHGAPPRFYAKSSALRARRRLESSGDSAMARKWSNISL